MAQSFSKIVMHLVFSTKDRRPWLAEDIQRPLWGYLAGAIKNLGGHPIQIGGAADHVHILFELPRQVSVAEWVRDAKVESSKWMKEDVPTFAWQSGYSVFSVSASNQPSVEKYIASQASRHASQSFQEEFLALLERHGIQYDERYVWA